MQISREVTFIPATGQPEYAVVPYATYLELKKNINKSEPSRVEAIQGNPIKHWRQERQLSQAALAQAADISIPYLSQLEHGLRVGSKSVLQRLAQALHVSIEKIL